MVRSNNKMVEQPTGVCLGCFNAQQRLSFPFLVYCRHRRVLAIVHGPSEHASFECSPEQLKEITRRLRNSNPGLQN